MRLPDSAHEAHPWVIARIAPDFRLLDAWALPVAGSRADFDAFLEIMDSLDPTHSSSAAARALFRLRFRLGALFGWDDATQKRPIPECSEATLATRLPDDLRGTAGASARRSGSRFVPLYRTDEEWAAEISNDTVHAVLHLGWVEQSEGRYRAQMGVYVKPRGLLGEIYMMLIGPFRHLIVYPALMRQIGRAWKARDITKTTDGGTSPATPPSRPRRRRPRAAAGS
ncbi:MAG: DUF2867 domain-containing protein [Deltaproteobacteria bacterium]|nr:MAG: DUF2867 domain-containing protein [Deltaproteobacteria bacterium]